MYDVREPSSWLSLRKQRRVVIDAYSLGLAYAGAVCHSDKHAKPYENGTSTIDAETYQIFADGQANLLEDIDMSVNVRSLVPS